jgi:hypothetical protein
MKTTRVHKERNPKMKASMRWIKVLPFQTISSPAIIAFAVVLLIICPTHGIQAGQLGIKCTEPAVWEGAAVNAVILPYTYTGHGQKPLSETAKELTLLVQMDVLFSMLKYGGVGTTVLSTRKIPSQQVREECTAEVVTDKVLGRIPGARSQIKPGTGVVILWGYIYEEGKDVFVQSYLRFLRRNAPDRISLTINSNVPLPMKFTGQLPDQAFAFAPKRLTVDELKEIGRAFRQSSMVRYHPNPSARGEKMWLDPDLPFQYRVTDARNGWMKIESYGPGPSGWVQAQVNIDEAPLSRKLPELCFVEGVVGYLRYQVHADKIMEYPHSGRIVQWTQRALSRFEEFSQKKKTSVPFAMAKILSGNISIISANPEHLTEAVHNASIKYAHAAELMPYNAEARNLLAMSRIYLSYLSGWSSEKPAVIAKELLNTLVLDANNDVILANLENFYVLVSKIPEKISQIQNAEIKNKLSAVRRVRSGLEKNR